MISDFPELSVDDILPDHQRMIASDAVNEMVRGVQLLFASFLVGYLHHRFGEVACFRNDMLRAQSIWGCIH